MPGAFDGDDVTRCEGGELLGGEPVVRGHVLALLPPSMPEGKSRLVQIYRRHRVQHAVIERGEGW